MRWARASLILRSRLAPRPARVQRGWTQPAMRDMRPPWYRTPGASGPRGIQTRRLVCVLPVGDRRAAHGQHRRVSRHAEGSCLIRMGDTAVLCTASLEESVPPSCAKPGSAGSRRNMACRRAPPPHGTDAKPPAAKQSGRTREIQRLIGRSPRRYRPGRARRTPDHRRLRRAAGRWRDAARRSPAAGSR